MKILMKQILIFTLLSLIIATSCTVSRQQVGNYEEMEGKATVIKKGKDFYLFWDQLPVQSIEENLEITDYEIIKKRRFLDTVILLGTIGIVSSYDVKVKTKVSNKK